MAPKAEPEKEKKEKKEKKEDKDDKEKKEKKEKKEEKEKKEKKEKEADDGKKKPKRLGDGGGFNAWESVGEATTDYTNTKKPQDKREIAAEKDKTIKKNNADAGLVKASDVVQEELKKMNEAKKKERDEKLKEEKKKEKEAKTAREAEAEQKEEFEIMDNSGAGNFMAKHEVMDIMKNTVAEASSSSSSRCQISPSTKMGDTAFLGKKTIFTALGDFAAVKGFVFIRAPKDEQGFNLKLTRPSVVYICHSERPDENDAWLTSWKELKEDVSLPELEAGAAPIVVGKRKDYKSPESKNVQIPKPPPGIECVLCFVQPDFHAKPFPSDEDLMTEEEKLEKKRQDAANARGSKANTTTSEKKKDDAEEQLEKVLKKVDAGEKLSNKEQRLYEKYKEKNKVWTNEEDEFAKEKGLNSFSISLPGGKNDPPAAGDAFTCDGFTITAPKQTLFDNASITIAQGKRYGILGPNGMGKTTILRHLHQREMPIPLNWDVILVEQEAKASNNTAVQEVIASDERVAELLLREAELIKKLEEIEENTKTGEGEQWGAGDFEKAREELSDIAAEMDARGADSAEARVRKILCGLGFTNGKPDEDRFSMDRPVVEFSGGWRMRISLAKALFLEPKLLMLDEPTNHLDLDAVLWLDHYLSEVYPHAVIVVSHDADFLDSICTDILHLENKKLIHYRGNYNQFKIMHQQKRDKLDHEYKKQQDMLRDLKKKGRTQDEAVAQVKARFNIDNLDDLMAKHKDYVVKFTFHGHGKDQSIGGVNVSEVAFSYNGKEPWLLDEVEIGVDCASRIAVVGPNGMGKSTLLNLMMEHLEPSKGEVTMAKGLRVKQYHQHFEELLPLDKDPTEYLISAFDLSPPERARAVLGQFGLPGASHFTKIGNLSGGQKARVAFSALMLMKPHIMILDEPTNHLDIESVEALTDAIKQFNGGLVLVTHDARLITAIDCDIWVVEHGECYKFEKGFDGYRDHVLEQLEERQAEVERMEKVRREAKQKERAKFADEKKIEAAKKRRDEEEKKKKASEEASAKETTKEKKAAKEEKEPEEEEAVMDFGEKKKKKDKKEKKDDEEAEEVMDFGEKKKKKDKKEKKDDEAPAPDTPEKKAPETPEKPSPSKSGGDSKAALRAELEEMKKGALRKRAKESGVSEDDLEEADDADDPKEAFIALILQSVEDDEEEAGGDSGEAALRAELEEMKKGALRKRAVAAGVDEAELEEADDEDDKQAYVELIVKYECKSSPASKDDAKKKAEAEKKEKEKEAEAKKKAEAEAAKKKEEEAKKKAEAAKKESESEEEDEDEDDDDDDDDDAIALALLKKKQQAKKEVEVASDPEEEQLHVQPKEDFSDDDKKKKNKKGATGKAKAKPKAKAKEEKKPWEQSDDEDEEAQGDDDGEDDGVDHAETNFGAKGTNKKNAPKAKAKGKDKKKKGDASDDDEVAAPKAKSKGGKKKNEDDDEDDDAPAPKAKGKAGKKKGDVSDDDDAPAPKAKGKAGKKKDDDDDEDGDEDAKGKMTAKSKRAAADAAKKAAAAEERRKREEAAKLEEEEEAAAGNRKKDKGKKGDKSESKADADDEEAPKSQKKGASAKAEADGGNDEAASDLIVSGVVASCEPLRKKGNFLVMVTVGDREVQIIDSAEHDAGKKVKVALEGATLPNGKTVKREKIGGEFSEGTLIK